MASLESLRIREKAAKGTVVQVGTNTPVAIRFRYVGGGTSVTSVTVTTATNIVFVSVSAAGATVTDTYAFATYATVGALVDKIDGDGRFEGKVLDTLRSKATASQFVDGAITASTVNGTTVWDMTVDTDVAKYFATCLSVDRGFDGLTRGHRVHLQEAKYYITLGGAGAELVKVWQRKYNGDPCTNTGTGIEEQLMALTSVSATETTINFAAGEGKLTGDEQSDLVVVITDGTSITNATANYLRISGIVE